MVSSALAAEEGLRLSDSVLDAIAVAIGRRLPANSSLTVLEFPLPVSMAVGADGLSETRLLVGRAIGRRVCLDEVTWLSTADGGPNSALDGRPVESG